MNREEKVITNEEELIIPVITERENGFISHKVLCDVCDPNIKCIDISIDKAAIEVATCGVVYFRFTTKKYQTPVYIVNVFIRPSQRFRVHLFDQDGNFIASNDCDDNPYFVWKMNLKRDTAYILRVEPIENTLSVITAAVVSRSPETEPCCDCCPDNLPNAFLDILANKY